MTEQQLELADIFRQFGPAYRLAHHYSLSIEHLRAMRAIELCRTAALGGHLDKCDSCGHTSISYNSCRNRHCPKCQNLDRAEWLEKRQAELLPLDYFHVIFTLPDCFSSMALQNKSVIYNILFRAASQSMLTIAADPKHLGAEIGFIALLHTWGQKLNHHPHLHCLVPGGGLSPDGSRFVACRKEFFLPVKVLSSMFQHLFIQYLKEAFGQGKLDFYANTEHLRETRAFLALLDKACQSDWVVYAKAPMGGPAQVIEYLGRYTHRVAISNHRLLKIEAGNVTFSWKDYKDDYSVKQLTLSATEFIRRFLLHILPSGFQRIRHFGYLSNRSKEKLALCRRLLGVSQESQAQDVANQALDWKARYELLTGVSLLQCPACKQGRMIMIQLIADYRSLSYSFLVRIDSS